MLGLVIWKECMSVISVEKDYETAVEMAEAFRRHAPETGEYFAVGINGQEARDAARITEGSTFKQFSFMGLVIDKKTMTVIDVERYVETAVEMAEALGRHAPETGEHFAVGIKGLVIDKKTMTVIDVERYVVDAVRQAKFVESLRPPQGEYFAARMLGYLVLTMARAQENTDTQAGIAASLAAADMED
jgi:hypothetical protein